MKTTLMIDDDLYRQAKITAAQRGVTIGSVVEEALRLLLITTADVTATPFAPSLPAWSLGEPRVDITDNRALREVLESDRDVDAVR